MSDGGGDFSDIPKEELIHLCMKMNKRMQAIETKGKEILKKKNQLQLERQKLLGLVERSLNHSFHSLPEQDLDVAAVEAAWNDWDTQRLSKIKDYENQLQELLSNPQLQTEKLTDGNVGAITASRDSGDVKDSQQVITKLQIDLEKARTNEKLLLEQVRVLETDLQERKQQNEQLKKENEMIKANTEEKIVYMQMTIHQQKQKEEIKQQEFQQLKHDLEKSHHRLEEKEILMQTNKEMIIALQARLMEIEPELSSYKEKISDLDRRFSALQVLKFEQDNLINSLRSDLKNALQEKERCQTRIKELEESRSKFDGQSAKITALQEEMNTLKDEIEEKSSLIVRLRSEIQTNEKNHAIRVAMLATSEAQNQELLKTIEQKNQEVKDLIDRITALQIDYSTLETALKEKTSTFNDRIDKLESQLVQEKKDYETLVTALKTQQEETIESLKKDFTKKSAMARSLLSEREEEVRVLSQKIKELQEEITSGAPAERKIFELAQVQSKREALHGIHRDTREIAFQQLQSALAAKDLELAQSQQLLTDLSTEISELRKVKQREGINMDYLKNVVFQYMTFPINSSERNALVPVLAMLLQFSAKEMTEIQKSVRDPIWGSRPVKEVKRIDFNALPSGSTHPASVSNSRPSNNIPVTAPARSSNTATISSLPASNINPKNPAVATSSLMTANNSKPGSGLSIKPVNHDFFVENENIAASKEFPSMSFDLMSPYYRDQQNKNAVTPLNPATSTTAATTINNNNDSTGLTERKDSEVSENDFELRQKLKNFTSDALDMSLSEDVDRTISNSQITGTRPASVMNQSGSASSSRVNLPDAGRKSEEPTAIKTTISGTSIDEQVFATNSKAL